MKYLRLTTHDPYYNLAVEEHLLCTADDDILMLWQNEPSVVVGINQNIQAEVDSSALAALGIHPVRRITGGGAVYHDLGNINYTFISKKGADGIDFATFSRPITDAMASLGVTLGLSGRNDLCLPDGRKVSGNAQCVRGDKLLHHGTLLFDADLGVLGSVLTPDPEKLKTKAVRSLGARVANLKELLPDISSSEELISLIEKFILDTLKPQIISPPENEDVLRLRARNASDEWIYPTRGVSSTYSTERKKRYPFGSVGISVSFRSRMIYSIKISGDFFGTRSVSELESLLSGRTRDELHTELTDKLISEFILGMTKDELLDLIFGE